MAVQLGGHGGRANLAPQNHKLNISLWRRIENSVLKCARAPETLRYQVRLNYPDDLSLRPSEWRAHIDLFDHSGSGAHSDWGFHLNNVEPNDADRVNVLTILFKLYQGHC